MRGALVGAVVIALINWFGDFRPSHDAGNVVARCLVLLAVRMAIPFVNSLGLVVFLIFLAV